MSVKLSEFIETSLVEIAAGVVAAAEKADVTIAPAMIEGKPLFEPQLVDFEVYVEASKETAVGGAINAGGTLLSVVGIKGDANTSKQSAQTSAQRIKFSVPVHFNSTNVRKG